MLSIKLSTKKSVGEYVNLHEDWDWSGFEDCPLKYYNAELPDWAINRKMGDLKNDLVTKKQNLQLVTNWMTWPMKNSKLGSFVWSWSVEIRFHHAVTLRLQVPFLLKKLHKLKIHSCDINICESTLVMASIEKIWYRYFFLVFYVGLRFGRVDNLFYAEENLIKISRVW